MPWASRTTVLQPVLNAGSIASVRFCPSGEARRSSRRFSAKTRTASLSASFFVCILNSVSRESESRRL